MIEIRECKSRKERRNFLNFPLKLYKNNPYFVPPLYLDEKKIFKSNYYYNKVCESKFYNAYKDNKMVGRIQFILQKEANKKWKQKRIRFTRFDCIDDQEVASKLFKKGFEFVKEKQMEEIVGPLGYSDFEREGLLIEGFEYDSTFEEQYNYSYYQKLIENIGFKKEIDWLERRLFPKANIDLEKYKKISNTILNRANLKLLTDITIKDVCVKYADRLFNLIDESYEDLYQTVPFLDSQRKDVIKAFKLILAPEYIRIIVDKNDDPVAFGLSFPSIGKAMRKSGGKLYPSTLIKLIKAIKHPEGLDLGLVGIKKKYLNSGVAGAIFIEILSAFANGQYKFYETNLNLEDNIEIQKNWEKFENIQHKKRRAFVIKVN